MDVNPDRLQFCRTHLGIEHTINPLISETRARLMEITSGDMPTVLIDATGNQRAINEGVHYLAHGGRYVLVGLQKNEISFPHPEFHKRETTLMSSRNATRADFDYVIQNISQGRIDVNKFITHTIPFEDIRAEFPTLTDVKRGVIKAMIMMNNEN
jgi:threonine dehydrogenase-like Zn-dependent dehydrogenase